MTDKPKHAGHSINEPATKTDETAGKHAPDVSINEPPGSQVKPQDQPASKPAAQPPKAEAPKDKHEDHRRR